MQDYLDAGWEVSIHAAPVSQGSWTGAGYIVVDQSTGAGAYLIEGAGNGGQLDYGPVAYDIGFAVSAGALAVSDDLVSGRLSFRVMFSETLRWQQTLGRASAALGWVGLLIQVGTTVADDSLTTAQRIGQISINVLSNFITAYLVSQLVALGLIGGLPIILFAFIMAFALSIAASLISQLYFTLRPQRALHGNTA